MDYVTLGDVMGGEKKRGENRGETRGEKRQTIRTRLSIVRAGGEQAEVEVRITDELSRQQFATLRVSYEDLGRALTGTQNIQCQAELVGLANVGKKLERKQIRVEKVSDEALQAALVASACERTPGWFVLHDGTSINQPEEVHHATLGRWVQGEGASEGSHP